MTGKSDLRRHFRQQLAELPPSQRLSASADLVSQLQAWPVFAHAGIVALFYPTATEPDLFPLTQIHGKTFLFPYCHADRSLTWHPLTSLTDWKRSAFGILEPDPDKVPEWQGAAPSLVLVPGLAFTQDGQRLGHGAGYYDRFLAGLTDNTTTAGVCFSCQLADSLPVEDHDIPVHRVFHA
jgi:5-formyltetrahydrofolate cyclo-ligase